jgi:hypothetical protein
MSRYPKNGSAGECRYCGQPFDGCVIQDRKTNRYYCSDDCLESYTCRPFLVGSVRVSAKCLGRLWEDVSCGSFSKTRSSRSSTMKP